jgi:hypothetical protein
MARSARAAAPPPALLAQRHSTLGGGSVAAPPILDQGRPLEPATRHEMEQGFGRDFGAVRVHDDARAHDSARGLGALAYAAGDDIVFGEGRYAPQTPAGRALIAHELAHNVQQGGVQMKAAGPLPAAADAGLEAEADGAALAITAGRPVPSLSRVAQPAIFRADAPPPVATPAVIPAVTPAATGSATPDATPAAVPDTKAVDPATVPGLPSDVETVEEIPKGTGATQLVVSVPCLTLPRVKGAGAWVKQSYDTMASGKRLIFSPIFDDAKNYGDTKDIRAFMEKPGDKYKDIWLQMYGFSTLQGMAKAIRDAAAAKPEVKAVHDKPEVKAIVDGFAGGTLTKAKCDIDHIVEKQIGGTSVPGNLQLLIADKNQESGRKTYEYMVAEVKRILEPNRVKVSRFQIRFKTAKVMDDTADASFEIETLLRKGLVTGSADVKKKAEGIPVALVAGGAPEVVSVKATGPTVIDLGERRLIPGMKLLRYVRGAPGAKIDKIEAQVASKPMLPVKDGEKAITLSATHMAAPVAAAAPVATEGAPAATPVVAPTIAASEWRKVTLDPTLNKDIPFYYPYLSKGKLTKVAIDASGGFSGEGVITPTVKFFGELKFKFAPDTIEAGISIPKEKLKTPADKFFRFTESTLSLTLAPVLVPKGEVKFTVGPATNPLLNGEIRVSYKDGAVIGIGSLTPARAIPGIKEAKADVGYNSQTGWSGKLTASSVALPGATEVTAEIGFNEKNGALVPYGAGGFKTRIKEGSELFLKAGWDGVNISYAGGVKVLKPLPLVKEVTVNGSYANGLLYVEGKAPIKWKNIDAEMTVFYRREDGKDGKFGGTATINVTTPKASGELKLGFNEAGGFWGSGSLSYQVTKDIRPKLGVEIKAGRIRLFGAVDVADIPLGTEWPKPGGTRKDILKAAAKISFPIPPLPAVTAYLELKGSLGVGYGVGPLTLKGIKFNGELYPFEDDPKIAAHLTGRISMPAYAELYGTFGAYIGAEILGGAAGAKGGVEVTPSLRLPVEAYIQVDVDYEEGGFKRAAGEAAVTGALEARLVVDLKAEVYALYGLLSHTWTYNVRDIKKPVGPPLKLTLGTVAWEKGTGIKWPSLSDIKLEPADVDPLSLIKDLLGSSKADKAGSGASPEPMERGNKI